MAGSEANVGRNLRVPLGILLALTLLAAGCGKDEPKLAAVKGTIYFRGTPLQGGFVAFTPDPERGVKGPIAQAEIGLDGTFTLKSDSDAGAVPGWHLITIGSTDPATSLPARYRNPEQSRESREVKPGILNVFDIRLE
jgi:hypothetical protein